MADSIKATQALDGSERGLASVQFLGSQNADFQAAEQSDKQAKRGSTRCLPAGEGAAGRACA